MINQSCRSTQSKKTEKLTNFETVLAIFNEMDPDMTGRITYTQLIKPKFKEWNDFLRVISQRGSRDREIVRRLRSRGTNH